MSDEVLGFALKNTIQELQNVCPDITGNFIFKEGKILAKDDNTKEETASQTIDAFGKITEHASIIGEIDAVSIEGVKGKVNIASLKDFHLTTVSSKKADEKYVSTLTRVLIPIVIKLAQEIQSCSAANETIRSDDDAIETIEPELIENEITKEIVDELEPEDAENTQPDELNEEYLIPKLQKEKEPAEVEVDNEPLIPEPPVLQLMVENLKGFRAGSDTVRVDHEVIAHRNKLYSDKKINEVEIEALNGKTTRCKFKKIKKSKDEGKGIVKMPEKIQVSLEIAAGELVTVKPVVE